MQSHKEVWFSVSDQEEHIYFRAYHQPHPVLDFIPWPIRVQGIYFDDGTSMFTANPGSPTGPTLIAGPGITFTYGVGTITIAASPWTADINANGFSLFNLGNLSGTNITLTGNLTTDGNLIISGPLSQFSGNVNIFGVLQAGTMNVLAGGNYSLNGIEFALQSGGQVNLQNIGNINGQTYPPPAGQFQTPWLSNINANGFSLFNVDDIGVNSLSGVTSINGVPIGSFSQTPWLSNIDGAGFSLGNAFSIGVGTAAPAQGIDIVGSGFLACRVNCTSPTSFGVFRLVNDSFGLSQVAMYGSASSNPSGPNSLAITNSLGDITFGSASTTVHMRLTNLVGNLGVNNNSPAYKVDVGGDVNITDPGGVNGYAFRINGVPIGAGAAQTPWLSNIDGARFTLTNTGAIGIFTSSVGTDSIRVQSPAGIPAVVNINASLAPTQYASLRFTASASNFLYITLTGPSIAGPDIPNTKTVVVGGPDLVFQAPSELLRLGNNFVGIRNPAPAFTLDVAGDINITDPGGVNGYAFRINGVPIGGGGSQTPWLSDINAAGFDLHNTGRIGIGAPALFNPGVPELYIDTANQNSSVFVENSSNNGQIGSGGAAGFLVSVAAAGGCASFTARNNLNHVAEFGIGGSASLIPPNADIASFYTNTSAITFLTFNNPAVVEQMRLTAAGNLGIGTGNPQALLDVAGMIRTTDLLPEPISGVGVEIYYDAADGAGVIQAFDRNALVYTPLFISGEPTQFAGRVGIAKVPSYALDVAGDVNVTNGSVIVTEGQIVGGVGSGGGVGDISVARPSSPTTGAIFFGVTGAYIVFDGINFVFNPPLSVAASASELDAMRSRIRHLEDDLDKLEKDFYR